MHIDKLFQSSLATAEIISKSYAMILTYITINTNPRKATSVMNIRKSNSSFGINNFGSSRNLSSSQCSLDVTALRGEIFQHKDRNRKVDKVALKDKSTMMT